MPITNLAIQRRRLNELIHILGRDGWFIQPYDLARCDGFYFVVRELSTQLAKHLQEANFEIMSVQLQDNGLRIYVHSETPEKDGCKVKRGIF